MPRKKLKSQDNLEKKKAEKTTSKQHVIYTKVSDETRQIIDKLKESGKTISYIISSAIDIYEIYNSAPQELIDFVDEYREEYGGRKNVVIEALNLMVSHKNREKASDIDLWYRSKEEINVMLINKKLFSELITLLQSLINNLDQTKMKNLALEPILWLIQKPIKSLSLEEFLNAIKKVWTVFNYFSLIEIKKESDNQFYLIFKHRQNIHYSNFWLNFFKNIFNSEEFSFKCKVKGNSYEETISITIKEIDTMTIIS
ncbi:MAG: hypothetical protein ACFFAO_05845 [Candidatus Hermodarchaeota archaeon]